MARKCKRKKTITIIQDYGPAKKKRVCVSYSKGRGGRRVRGRRKHRWCVFKGKSRVSHSCHTNKRAANHAKAVLRRSCRSRIRIRRVKRA